MPQARAVGPSEQATVRNGMAPIKTVLTNARDRVQWVSAVRLEAGGQVQRWRVQALTGEVVEVAP